MAVFVVFEAVCLALTVVQLDRFVARNQPLAILPTVWVFVHSVFKVVKQQQHMRN